MIDWRNSWLRVGGSCTEEFLICVPVCAFVVVYCGVRDCVPCAMPSPRILGDFNLN